MEHNNLKKEELQSLSKSIEGLSVEDALHFLATKFQGKVTFSSSFSYEDQVISKMIAQLPISIFTLDTGRLFKQTYATWNNTLSYLNISVDTYYPDAQQLQAYTTAHGPESFYKSVALRKECCNIRKVEPLQRALKNNTVWITGLRAEHSVNRENMEQLEWDEANQIFKYHPLLRWTNDEVIAYIKKYNIPYNILHEQGYVSIGCEPCTRAIKVGEDFRAGRWWWEDTGKKECGLHR